MKDKIKEAITERKNERRIFSENIAAKKNTLAGLREQIADIEQAQEILTEIGIQSQNFLKEEIEGLVTLCLQTVFKRDYRFIMDIKRERGAVSVKLKVRKPNGLILNPMSGGGGGVVDIAAFALRTILWSLEEPRSAPFMNMDEPFHFVHGYEEESSQIVKMLNEILGIQFLINTQIEEFVLSSDRVFRTRLNSREKTEVIVER